MLKVIPVGNEKLPTHFIIQPENELPIATISFTEGKRTVNGVTERALLEILEIRLQALQDGPKACCEYEQVLAHVRCAIAALILREAEST